MPHSITQSQLVRRIDEYVKELVGEADIVPSVEATNAKVTEDGYLVVTVKVWDRQLAQEMLDCGATLVPVKLKQD